MKQGRFHRTISCLALFVATVSACCHRNRPDPMPMEFAAQTDLSTRAGVVNDLADMQQEGFSVYGYKLSDYNFQVFNNVPVTYVNGRWTYHPTNYWDIYAQYFFAAYSPQLPATVSASSPYVQEEVVSNERFLSLCNLPQWQLVDGSEQDFMWAADHGTAVNYVGIQQGMVTLNFQHLLAQLEVRCYKKSSLTNDYRIHKVILGSSVMDQENVPTIANRYRYTRRYLPADAPDEVQIASMNAALQKGQMTLFDNESGFLVPVFDQLASHGKLCHYLVFPFQTDLIIGLPLTIDYSIDGEPFQSTIVSDLCRLEANGRYVLMLRFESGYAINGSLLIKEWDEVDTEDEVYNW